MQLHNFDLDLFLRDYWQKRPLLIRNAFADWVNPLEPEELAGLACEEGVESRLITRKGDGWSLEHGPFDESRFTQSRPDPWTLLVQAVDHHVPVVAALLAPFRFIPNWRIDDVMVSYATDGGGVGPHFDQYDVFLLQGAGQRRWRLGPLCDDATPLAPHEDLRLLADFEATDEWLLEPGDMLYVPPRLAHDGVAVGQGCMTYSIGFRAPSRSDLITHWTDHLIDTLAEDDRYEDRFDLATQRPPANPGEISPAALARLHAMVTEKLLDAQAFARWFGAYSSTRKYPDTDWRPEDPITPQELRDYAGQPLCRNPASRFAFIRHEDALTLFVDGESFPCCTGDTARLAEMLCAEDHLLLDPALAQSDAALTLLATLLNHGSIAFEDEDEVE